MQSAHLYLDGFGTVEGRLRSPGMAAGEAVFTTAQTGYEESITDPSYTGQILIFTYPLIGNYGVRKERFESREPHVKAVVARELTDDVAEWLKNEGIPAIDKVDTRELTLHLRDEGSSEAALTLSPYPEFHAQGTKDFDEMKEYVLNSVHIGNSIVRDGNGPTVGFIDCGAKRGIIDEFLDRDVKLIRYPHDVSPSKIRYDDPDILFISNGPGDPEWFEDVKHTVCAFAGEIPLAGICLGQQIIALALGGETKKMKFGHHGINQPVYNDEQSRVKITTQNHGYEVSDPGELDVVEWNVNDESAEGLHSDELNVLTRQYHPEARPGPHDSLDFFDRVIGMSEGETDRVSGRS